MVLYRGLHIQKEHLHASRSYEELNDVCFEGFLTLGGGSKNDNSQKFNSLRNAGQVNMQLVLTSFYRVCQTISYEILLILILLTYIVIF